ncbi:MAG: prepilin-type N-terminal cleavage/methylation domain-containing protein [Desulfobacterales bacterium]|jgi:type IV pilus assembly protein PilW
MKHPFRFSTASKNPQQINAPVAGFTLIELLITIAMISIFAAAAMAVLIPLSRSYTTTDVASSAQQVVRMAVEVMANDIRLAGLDPLKQADAGIEEANATSIRFTCDRVNVGAGDTEANGEIENSNFENVQYYYEAATESLNLRLYSGAPVQTTQQLVENVSNLEFRYFDQDGNITAELNDIRSVQISMTVEEEAGAEGPIERSYSTRVLCRNLGI